jgi:hypothetical protein
MINHHIFSVDTIAWQIYYFFTFVKVFFTDLDIFLFVCFGATFVSVLQFQEKFEDTKGVIRSRKSKTDKQHNGQKK